MAWVLDSYINPNDLRQYKFSPIIINVLNKINLIVFVQCKSRQSNCFVKKKIQKK